MAEYVILFAGPMGAGKTTAIRALSEIEVISTEAGNSDRVQSNKATTTVALDYGEIVLGDDAKVRLYGMPGQRRFNFMWDVLRKRAMGLILLVNADAPDPMDDLSQFLSEFADLHERGGIVVCVTRSDEAGDDAPSLSDYAAVINARLPGAIVPVFTVDARESDHLRTALLALVINIETRSAPAPDPAPDFAQAAPQHSYEEPLA